MTRLLEYYYLAGVPLGLGALVVAVVWKKGRRPLIVTTLTLIGAWALTVQALTARSALLVDHGIDPRTTDAIKATFGSPDFVVEEDSKGVTLWLYTVRVSPWHDLLAYHIAQDGRVLAIQHNERAGFWFKPEEFTEPFNRGRDLPEVRRYLAERDTVTWAIISAPPKEDIYTQGSAIFQGMWSPEKSDVPAVINAAFAYLKTYTDAAENPNAGDPARPSLKDYRIQTVAEILAFQPKYACQIVGYTTKDGKKMIHLNFFPRLEYGFTEFLPGTTELAWHTRYVEVMDGGSRFWQIDYDPASRTFSDFKANGPA